MIFDFHSHILPFVDDGAKDAATSREMLDICRRDGVTDIVSTSHCYPQSEEDIEDFIRVREKSLGIIKDFTEDIHIYRGCEVHLTGDLTRFSNIKKLCVEKTGYMLLEMPASEWKDDTLDNVYKLTLAGITPIIAHHERNCHQKKDMRMSLLDLEVLVQVNLQSVWDRAFKKEIDRLMRMGMVHLVGTDMHNLTSRKPCAGKGEKVITRRYGKEAWDYFADNAEKIIKNKEINYREFKSFKRKTFF